jgi:transcriptional regulator with XRE-family HTH domain
MSMISKTKTNASDEFVNNFCGGAFGVLFGEEITALREEQDLTIEQAAGRADMTPARWLGVERGRVPDSWPMACRMAEALGISHLAMAAMIVRYSKAWDQHREVPDEISKLYS